jgi:hypothetical protein
VLIETAFHPRFDIINKGATAAIDVSSSREILNENIRNMEYSTQPPPNELYIRTLRIWFRLANFVVIDEKLETPSFPRLMVSLWSAQRPDLTHV